MIAPRRTLWFLCLLALAGLGAGCAHKDAALTTDKPLSQAQIDAMIKTQAVKDPYLRSQLNFGLEARLAAPGRIQATVTNKTEKPIVVGHKCFALILPGNHKEIRASEKSVKLFPLAKVGTGEQASGELIFPVSAIPHDARLVFVQPPAEPAMAPIR